MLLGLVIAPALIVLAEEEDNGGGKAAEQGVRAGRLPTDVVVTQGTVWVASGRDNRIIAIDAARPQETAERHVTGTAPLRLAVGEDGSIWTADAASDTVTRVNPLLPGSVGRRIAIRADAVDIAIGYDGAWVTNGQRGTITHRPGRQSRSRAAHPHRQLPDRRGDRGQLRLGRQLRRRHGRARRSARRARHRPPRRVGRDPQDIAVGFGTVWVANRGGGTVTRLSAATGRRLGRAIAVGGAPAALAVTRDGVLVLDSESGRVLMIDPEGEGARELATVPGFPTAMAVGAGAAWVVDARNGTVTRVGAG